MAEPHRYHIHTRWTGNRGTGTSAYQAYSRDHEMAAPGKAADIPGSSDPAYRGDPSRYNPEELLVAALSACHMLWVLHLCARAGIVVTDYEDDAEGEIELAPDGGGRFRCVTLRPRIAITDAARTAATEALQAQAHALCFIANSVNFPVTCEARVQAAGA